MPATIRKISDDLGAPMDRIRRFIENPPETSRVFEITPDMAKQILTEFNTGNRTKKPVAIAKYADYMANDEWALTGDTLKFSDLGRLRDGQNRLMACARSGVPFRTHIVFGVPDSAFDVMDQGRNRSGADILSIAGYDNVTALAGAIRWAALISSGRAKQRDTFEPDQLLSLIQTTHSGLTQHIKQGRAIYVATNQPISLVIALLYLFHQANPGLAREFSAAWETGERGGKFKPLALMQAQITTKKELSSGRLHDVERAALIVKAWNLFVSKRRGRQSDITWKLSEPFPEIAR